MKILKVTAIALIALFAFSNVDAQPRKHPRPHHRHHHKPMRHRH